MANNPVPDTLEVEVRGTLNGQDCENTFYYKYVTIPDELELQDFVDALAVAVNTEWLANLPTGFVGREIYVKDLSAPITVQATSNDIAGSTGTSLGETLPSTDTIAIARTSGLTGRSSRGRIFWMGLSHTQVDGNLITITAANNILNAVAAFDGVATGFAYAPVIVSRYQDHVKLTVPQTYAIALWHITDFATDTRRSRKPGSGS